MGIALSSDPSTLLRVDEDAEDLLEDGSLVVAILREEADQVNHTPPLHNPATPPPHHPTTPPLHHSTTISPHHHPTSPRHPPLIDNTIQYR